MSQLSLILRLFVKFGREYVILAETETQDKPYIFTASFHNTPALSFF